MLKYAERLDAPFSRPVGLDGPATRVMFCEEPDGNAVDYQFSEFKCKGTERAGEQVPASRSADDGEP
jgi:hypothetical protein